MVDQSDILAFLTGIRRRKCIIFGAGPAAHEFLDRIPIPIAFAVDNDHQRWGQKIRNIEIRAPSALRHCASDDFVVIIASSAVEPISEQVAELGFKLWDDVLVSPFVDHATTFRGPKKLLTSCFGKAGGLYLIDLETKEVTRVFTGSCRGLVKHQETYLVAIEEKGLVKFDPTFTPISETVIDPSMRLHGLCFNEGSDSFLATESGTGSIGIYDGASLKLIDRHYFGKNHSAPSDQHYINDITIHEGHVFVCVFSLNGVWRQDIWNDGAIVELDRNMTSIQKVVVHGLAQPHSMHFDENQLYFCNSMDFQVRLGDRLILQLNGYTRGLAGYGSTLFVGQSRVRRLTRFQDRFSAISLDTGVNVCDKFAKTYSFIPVPAEALFDIVVI